MLTNTTLYENIAGGKISLGITWVSYCQASQLIGLQIVIDKVAAKTIVVRTLSSNQVVKTLLVTTDLIERRDKIWSKF